MQVRSCGVQLADTEASFNAYLKEIAVKRSKLVHCDKQLDDLRERKVYR